MNLRELATHLHDTKSHSLQLSLLNSSHPLWLSAFLFHGGVAGWESSELNDFSKGSGKCWTESVLNKVAGTEFQSAGYHSEMGLLPGDFQMAICLPVLSYMIKREGHQSSSRAGRVGWKG